MASLAKTRVRQELRRCLWGSTLVSTRLPQRALLRLRAPGPGAEKLASIPVFAKTNIASPFTKVIVVSVVIALAVTLFAGSARAILLMSPTKKGKFTLGATELWYHRDQEWTDGSGTVEDKYNLGAFFARYGIHDRVTIFAEFALWNGDPHRQWISYRHINLGAGANVILYQTKEIDVSLLLNYFENFQHDNQETACHITTRHWAGLIQVTQTYDFSQKKHEAAVWIGSGLFKDEQIFNGGACSDAKKETEDNLGFAIGVDFLFWDHLELFAHLIYIDLKTDFPGGYFQPRLGIGYQF
ncbi:MAG: hypothetical protein JSW58_04165 [Candidatus Latescibacterota bacterium]|nr:MAG: hypothetical protein JSW58_04165 [Candidatus Latescibacterota bacterium]